jgi:class 3 adenylate cyclase
VDEQLRSTDEDRFRVGDAAKEATIAALRDAVGDGRLTLDEFADRAGTTYAASTVGELRAVLADLPDSQLPVVAPTVPAPPPTGSTQRIVAVMSGSVRRGRWQVGAEVSAIAVMGGVELDLYDAELGAGVTTIRAFALMGGIQVFVPEGIPVQVEGFVLMGGLEDRTRGSRTGGGAPMVRVIGHGMWGGIDVRHRKPKRGRPEPAAPAIPAGRVPAPVPTPTPTYGATPAAIDPSGLDGDTVTLLFTDIVDSTGLAEHLGDQRWFGVLSAHNALVREQVARHGGEEVKAQGDGFMVAFRSARRALLAAIGIQRALADHRQVHPDQAVHVRVGLHTGEVVASDGDLFGRNVILTSRITAAAGADEVLASALTKQLADAGGDLGFGAGRPVALKGLSGDWVVHPVEWS